MTPKTAHGSQVPAGNLDDYEKRLDELRAEQERLTKRSGEINDEIGPKIAAGEDVQDLRERRREIKTRIEDVEAAIDSVRRTMQILQANRKKAQTVRDRIAEEAREEAETIDERINEALALYREAVEKCNDVLRAYARQRARDRALSRLLCPKYGIEKPDIPDVPTPRVDDRLNEIVHTEPTYPEPSFRRRAVVWAPDGVAELIHKDDEGI